MALVEHLQATGATLLDVQWRTEHLATLGVVEIPREEYLHRVAIAVAGETSRPPDGPL